MEDKTVVENTSNIFHAPWKYVEVSSRYDIKVLMKFFTKVIGNL